MNKAKNYKQKKSLKDRKTFSLPRPNFFQRILLSSASSLSRISAAHQIPSISRTIGYSAYKINAADYIYNSLPSVSDFFERADKFDVDLRYTVATNRFRRLVPPPKGKDFMINVSYAASKEQRETILRVFDEYNRLFAIINPAYHFKVNFNPTDSDLNSIHSVTINVHDLKKTFGGRANYRNVRAYCSSKLKQQKALLTYPITTGIQLNPICFEFRAGFKYVVEHEFAHMLGLLDDYLLKDQFSFTLMSDGWNLSPNDLAILDCLYRHPNNPHPDKKIKAALNDLAIDVAADTFNIDPKKIYLKPSPQQMKTEFKNNGFEWDDRPIKPLDDREHYVMLHDNHEQHYFNEFHGDVVTNTYYSGLSNKFEKEEYKSFFYKSRGIRFELEDNVIGKFYTKDDHVFVFSVEKHGDETHTFFEYIGDLVSKEKYFAEKSKLDEIIENNEDISK